MSLSGTGFNPQISRSEPLSPQKLGPAPVNYTQQTDSMASSGSNSSSKNCFSSLIETVTNAISSFWAWLKSCFSGKSWFCGTICAAGGATSSSASTATTPSTTTTGASSPATRATALQGTPAGRAREPGSPMVVFETQANACVQELVDGCFETFGLNKEKKDYYALVTFAFGFEYAGGRTSKVEQSSRIIHIVNGKIAQDGTSDLEPFRLDERELRAKQGLGVVIIVLAEKRTSSIPNLWSFYLLHKGREPNSDSFTYVDEDGQAITKENEQGTLLTNPNYRSRNSTQWKNLELDEARGCFNHLFEETDCQVKGRFRVQLELG